MNSVKKGMLPNAPIVPPPLRSREEGAASQAPADAAPSPSLHSRDEGAAPQLLLPCGITQPQGGGGVQEEVDVAAAGELG